MSTTTGLTRREVSRLLEAGDEAPLPAPHSLTGEVLVRWMADPLYQRQGRPLALPRTGDAPSFEALGKLAAVAAIRTALNYFLSREIQEEQRTMAARPTDSESRDALGGPGS